jgi:molybdopterin-guanine dinucleotide biosynthesis protein A
MTQTSKTLGVILAGGASQRFQSSDPGGSGHDKFLAPFGTTTLLGHIIDRAAVQVDLLLLNVNGDPARVEDYGLGIIADQTMDQGPLAGLMAALTWAEQKGYDHVVSFSADCPFFPLDYRTRLEAAVQDQKTLIAIASSSHRPHPVMGLFPVLLQRDLAEYLQSGNRRVMQWVERHAYKEVVWNDNGRDPFFNINTRAELAQAEKYLTLQQRP